LFFTNVIFLMTIDVIVVIMMMCREGKRGGERSGAVSKARREGCAHWLISPEGAERRGRPWQDQRTSRSLSKNVL